MFMSARKVTAAVVGLALTFHVLSVDDIGAVNDGGSGTSNDKQTYDEEAAEEIAREQPGDQQNTPDQKKSAGSDASDTPADRTAGAFDSSNVPWIVGGVLAGLISLEVFIYLLVRMLRKNKS